MKCSFYLAFILMALIMFSATATVSAQQGRNQNADVTGLITAPGSPIVISPNTEEINKRAR